MPCRSSCALGLTRLGQPGSSNGPTNNRSSEAAREAEPRIQLLLLLRLVAQTSSTPASHLPPHHRPRPHDQWTHCAWQHTRSHPTLAYRHATRGGGRGVSFWRPPPNPQPIPLDRSTPVAVSIRAARALADHGGTRSTRTAARPTEAPRRVEGEGSVGVQP